MGVNGNMKTILESLIKLILSKLVNISADQWKEALNVVVGAFSLPKEQRFKTVFAKLQDLFDDVGDGALNLLIETAVAYAKKFLVK